MADITVKYKGNVIAEMSSGGTKTLETAGNYCEDNISVTYTPRADDSFRRWDVYITGEINNSKTTILQDDWLSEHKADPNLCILIKADFPIEPVSDVSYPAMYCLGTNTTTLIQPNGTQIKTISAFSDNNGGVAHRYRTKGISDGNDLADVVVNSQGELAVVLHSGHAFLPGEYSVIAWLM